MDCQEYMQQCNVKIIQQCDLWICLKPKYKADSPQYIICFAVQLNFLIGIHA